MIMTKILSFLFGIKKSNFRITKEELAMISDINEEDKTIVEKEILDIDSVSIIDTVPTYKDTFKELSNTIFEEVLNSMKISGSNYWRIKLTSLPGYQFLSEQEVAFKRNFSYWILDEIITHKNAKSENHNSNKQLYLEDILEKLLKSNLGFKEKDFIYFMNFWVKYPTHVQIGFLTAKLRKKVKKYAISPNFYYYLKKFLKSPRFNNSWYSYYENSRNTIEIILRDYAFDKAPDQPSFVLVSDPYADYINKTIKNKQHKEQEAYCEILKILETNKNFDNPRALYVSIEKHIENIGKINYNEQVIHFIKRASVFKPKMRNLRIEKKAYSSKDVQYNCQYMHKENIAVLKGFILSHANCSNKEDIIPYLLKIIERSYSNSKVLTLGKTCQSLGQLCIFTLANHYKEKGKQEVRKIYLETKFKKIKADIIKQSKQLKETTGTPLLKNKKH